MIKSCLYSPQAKTYDPLENNYFSCTGFLQTEIMGSLITAPLKLRHLTITYHLPLSVHLHKPSHCCGHYYRCRMDLNSCYKRHVTLIENVSHVTACPLSNSYRRFVCLHFHCQDFSWLFLDCLTMKILRPSKRRYLITSRYNVTSQNAWITITLRQSKPQTCSKRRREFEYSSRHVNKDFKSRITFVYFQHINGYILRIKHYYNIF